MQRIRVVSDRHMVEVCWRQLAFLSLLLGLGCARRVTIDKGNTMLIDETKLPIVDFVSLPRQVTAQLSRAQIEKDMPAPTVTAYVRGSAINVTALVANKSDKPLELLLRSVSYGDLEVFAAYLRPSEQVRYTRVADGASPSVLQQNLLVRIPAKTVARFSSQIMLDDFSYEGEARGTIEWSFGYANWETRAGTLYINLPRQK